LWFLLTDLEDKDAFLLLCFFLISMVSKLVSKYNNVNIKSVRLVMFSFAERSKNHFALPIYQFSERSKS
jgi:hypothetical protein